MPRRGCLTPKLTSRGLKKRVSSHPFRRRCRCFCARIRIFRAPRGSVAQHQSWRIRIGGRTVSIPERQLIATREPVKTLEAKLAELLKFGENDAVAAYPRLVAQTHCLRWCRDDRRYTVSNNAGQLPGAARGTAFCGMSRPPRTRRSFSPWPLNSSSLSETMKTSRPFIVYPYETHLWFGDHAPHLKSYALVLLHGENAPMGLFWRPKMPPRFTQTWEPCFDFIGEVAAHCLLRHLAVLPAPEPQVPAAE